MEMPRDQLTTHDRNRVDNHILSNYIMYTWDGDEFDGTVIWCENKSLKKVAEAIYEDDPDFWPSAVAVHITSANLEMLGEHKSDELRSNNEMEEEIRAQDDCREFCIQSMKKMIKCKSIYVLPIKVK